MSLLSPTRTYFSEKVRYAAGLGQSGKFRINVQIGINQFHVSILLPETRTFNYIMDELQPMFKLSDFQRQHTRIFLQTLLGETEVLVDARPNYQTQRNVDYVAVPSNPVSPTRLQQKSRLICYLLLFFLVQVIALSIFLAVEFAVLRPRLIQAARKNGMSASSQGQVPPGLPLPLPPGTTATPTGATGTAIATTTGPIPPAPLPNSAVTLSVPGLSQQPVTLPAQTVPSTGLLVTGRRR